jgi:hypothetical protein
MPESNATTEMTSMAIPATPTVDFPRRATTGVAMRRRGNGCDNFRFSSPLVSANMTTAVASCGAAKPTTAEMCYVLDESGATIPDVSNCVAASGSWRPRNSCCNFLGTLSCPP